MCGGSNSNNTTTQQSHRNRRLTSSGPSRISSGTLHGQRRSLVSHMKPTLVIALQVPTLM